MVYNQKLDRLKKKFRLNDIRVIWECQFKEMLEKEENKEFKNNVEPNLIHWKRLSGRESLFSGTRQTFCHKWTRDDNPNENMHFIGKLNFHFKISPLGGTCLCVSRNVNKKQF